MGSLWGSEDGRLVGLPHIGSLSLSREEQWVSIRVLRVVDDPADKAHEGYKKNGCVRVPAGEELGKQAIDLVDESRHAAKVSAKVEVECGWCGTGRVLRRSSWQLCMLTNGPPAVGQSTRPARRLATCMTPGPPLAKADIVKTNRRERRHLLHTPPSTCLHRPRVACPPLLTNY